MCRVQVASMIFFLIFPSSAASCGLLKARALKKVNRTSSATCGSIAGVLVMSKHDFYRPVSVSCTYSSSGFFRLCLQIRSIISSTQNSTYPNPSACC
jgi:hypothetical protein